MGFTKEQREGIENVVKLVDDDTGFKVDRNAQKRDDCAACKEDIPIMVNEKGERLHLDLFATPEAGAMYPCPCPEKPEDAELV